MREGGSDLEQATRVEQLEPPDGDGVRCRALLSDEWEIWGPNGGYLAAIALRAAGLAAQIPRPAGFYCHFLTSPAFEEVQLDVSVLKRGRRAESFTVAMSQRGEPVLHALVKTAAEAPGYEHRHLEPPQAPAPAALKSYEELSPDGPAPRFSFWRNVERRPLAQAASERPARPELREWARYRPNPRFGDPFVDAARSLILLDTYGFPAVYEQHRSFEYVAPNLDTSAWFHDLNPDSEWLLIDHESPLAARGFAAVAGRVWDEHGRLVASGAAQLCCLPGRR